MVSQAIAFAQKHLAVCHRQPSFLFSVAQDVLLFYLLGGISQRLNPKILHYYKSVMDG